MKSDLSFDPTLIAALLGTTVTGLGWVVSMVVWEPSWQELLATGSADWRTKGLPAFSPAKQA